MDNAISRRNISQQNWRKMNADIMTHYDGVLFSNWCVVLQCTTFLNNCAGLHNIPLGDDVDVVQCKTTCCTSVRVRVCVFSVHVVELL